MTLARSALGNNCTASAGNPSATRAARKAATSAAFDRAADELPRSSTALPDFNVSPKASTVTFGLPSYTMPTTPSGTRCWRS